MPEITKTMDFDPFAPETFDSPHETHAHLRAQCPVAHSDRWNGFWALTKHEDVVHVLTNPQTYITSVQNVVPKVAFTGRRPPLHLDPPAHTPYRKALNPLFTDARMKALEPRIREYTRKSLIEQIARRTFDVVQDFSVDMPVYSFAEFLNVDEEVMGRIHKVAIIFSRAVSGADDENVKSSSLQLYAIAKELIEERKLRPLDPSMDPTTALLRAKDEERQLAPRRDDSRHTAAGAGCGHHSAMRHHRQLRGASVPPSGAAGAASSAAGVAAGGARGTDAPVHAIPRLCADGKLRCGDSRQAHHAGRADRADLRLREPR